MLRTVVISLRNHPGTGRAGRLGVTLLLAGLPAGAGFAQAVQDFNGNGTVDTWAGGGDPDGHCIYHPQVTAYFCGAAAMETELDCSAVRNANAVLDTCLGAGVRGATPGAAAVDGLPQPVFPFQLNWTPPVYGVVGGNNVVTFGFQSYCYQLVHGLSTYNGLTYCNPFYTPGMGTSLDDMQVGLNLMDSPWNLSGPHNYISYNILNPAWANRTMANCLWQLGIPAAATVMHGAHWVNVVGVETDVDPVFNGRYNIYGFFVQDPWTGYQQVNPFDQRGNLVPEGLGENKFCSTRINPNRVAGDQMWSALFNTAGGPPWPYYGYGVGYKFEVEPVGPIALDTGNNGEYTSVPDPSPILTNAPLSAVQALAYATNELAANTFLSEQTGLDDGGWDLADATLVQYPSDAPGEGDWLIPYDGSGGTNDVTGFVMIDIETGDLDEAVWMNPGDYVSSMSLTNIEAMETEEFSGIVPDDNVDMPPMSIQYDGGITNVVTLGSPNITNSVFFGTNAVTITWPSSEFITNAFTLQQTFSLLPTGWTNLAVTVTTNTAGQFQAVVPVTGSQGYFRLMTPSVSTNN